jgi:HSP20 family protein
MAEKALETVNGTDRSRRDEEAVTLTPRVDVLETDNELLVYTDVPGVKSGDVDIRFENGDLTVHARRSQSHADKEQVGWEGEATGYYRTFRVTEQIAADRIEAELKNGVLTLHLPKVESVKPRRIAVRG